MLAELIDLARRNSSEIEDANKRMEERLYRSTAALQSQIDHVANILTPASSLSPAWVGAAGILGNIQGPQGPQGPQPVYGRVAPSDAFYGGPADSPGTKVAKSLGEAAVLRDRLKAPSGKPQKK